VVELQKLSDILTPILGFLATTVAGYIGYEVHRARESIADLNTSIRVIISRVDDHARRITHLEDHQNDYREKKK
jgi:hypothetical protein